MNLYVKYRDANETHTNRLYFKPDINVERDNNGNMVGVELYSATEVLIDGKSISLELQYRAEQMAELLWQVLAWEDVDGNKITEPLRRDIDSVLEECNK